MRKQGVAIILMISLIGFVSAYGSYGFSIGDFLDSIDSSTIILGTLFIIFFGLLNFSLSKVFKDKQGYPNKGIAGVVSFAISLLMIYGINKSNLNIEDFFFDIGISEGALFIVGPIIILIGLIFLAKKIGLSYIFLIIGSALILITLLTNWIYEKGTVLAIGIFFLVLWFIGRSIRKKNKV
ncbi:MAG: hypothetical protein ABIH59_03020 [archaeon]